MDPNLIHLDWERTAEALTLVILFAFVVERVLAVIFESRFYIEHLDVSGLKELVAVAASVAICWRWKLDVVGMFMLTETTTAAGYIITGFLVAGGSKAAIKLFRDVMGIKSTAYDERHEIRAAKAADTAKRAADDVPEDAPVERVVVAARVAKKAASRARTAAGASKTESARSAASTAEEIARRLHDRAELQVTRR